MSLQKFLEKWRQMPLSSVFQRQEDFPIGAASRVRTEVLSRFYPDYPLLPIEFLKLFPDQIEMSFQNPPDHFFLSSGTSQRDRSRSSFSKEGMNLYHEFSLLSFRAMIERFFPADKTPAGYSFIPSTGEWPTSSLAQMVSWIGEEFPLTYWNPTTPLPNKPVWLFATGFHIVSFADEGGRFLLPKGSIVIETGGTKGKTRSVTREELYGLISESFGVDANHIVSEYGMCELASQAYDYVDLPSGSILPLAERWFRFPTWVQTKILSADQTVHAEGDGSLIVDDRIRSDLGIPFRTEDRALLRADGAFQLKGRVAFSPLKGCSLLAEDILKQPGQLSSLAPTPNRSKTSLPSEVLEGRARELHRRTQFMLNDPEFKALIQASLIQDRVSEWCLDDLRASVPPSVSAWMKAAENSQNELDSWLFIPPRTHDFAIVHPLFLAALLDLKVLIRPASDPQLLNYWQRLFHGFWQFELIDPAWRLQPGEEVPAAGLLAYGSDETIAELKASTTAKVQGFGTWITISVIHKESWTQDEWVKDTFSLKQQGCMSARLLFVWDEETPVNLPQRTASIGSLSHGDHLHLAHSELAMVLEGYALLPRHSLDDLVLGQKALTSPEGIEDLLSLRPLTLPVIRISRSDLSVILKAIAENDSFKLLSCDEPTQSLLKAYPKIMTRELGKANAAPWSGVHGRQALFFPEGPVK